MSVLGFFLLVGIQQLIYVKTLNLQGMLCVDYEADVEDDINPIFRRGEVLSISISISHWVLITISCGIFI